MYVAQDQSKLDGDWPSGERQGDHVRQLLDSGAFGGAVDGTVGGTEDVRGRDSCNICQMVAAHIGWTIRPQKTREDNLASSRMRSTQDQQPAGNHSQSCVRERHQGTQCAITLSVQQIMMRPC